LKQEQSIYTVDAFTDAPFSGNPAGVCILPAGRPEDWMQKVAREMNLSETAFLHPVENGFALRWFTPTVEVSLCGHATLASAHMLWELNLLKSRQIARFETKSGLLTAESRGEIIQLNFPAKPVVPARAPDGLLAALGAKAIYLGRNHLDYLLEIESENQLRLLQPDFRALGQIPVRGIIVTARSADPRFDFVSRFFAPASGVNEDPVTGSAHCALGPYWQGKLGTAELLAYQASARGGVVKVRVAGERVWLGGKAVTVVRGELAQAALAF
jgi:PhzF family phenazine biosynthesis protein